MEKEKFNKNVPSNRLAILSVLIPNINFNHSISNSSINSIKNINSDYIPYFKFIHLN